MAIIDCAEELSGMLKQIEMSLLSKVKLNYCGRIVTRVMKSFGLPQLLVEEA